MQRSVAVFCKSGSRNGHQKDFGSVRFSEYADYALDWAQEWAERWKSTISLIYIVLAVSQLVHPESVQLLGLAGLAADMVVDAEHRLQKVVAQRGMQTMPTGTRALLGNPVLEICQFAEQQHSDLIIMGSHGRTGLAHVFLGSVAERVVRHSPCPVLVVRLPHTGTDYKEHAAPALRTRSQADNP